MTGHNRHDIVASFFAVARGVYQGCSTLTGQPIVGESLDLCSLAWGEQAGYVCLAVRDPALSKEHDEYWRDHWYQWPVERDKVGRALDKATTMRRDVYFTPGVFSKPKRGKDTLLPTDSLWSDLDTADPRDLPSELEPAAWWKTSPGHWQAIWKMPEAMPAQLQQQVNQALTYAIEADKGGWDAGQVLRIPGTRNHKYEDLPLVELEQLNGKRVPLSQVADLLVKGGQDGRQDSDERGEGELITDEGVLRKLRTRLPRYGQSLLRRRVQPGQRSERLWEFECVGAESGLSAIEIASLAYRASFNKFRGRTSGVSQLITEARKAIAHVTATNGPPPEVTQATMAEEVEDEDSITPVRWGEFDRDHKPITWLIEDVWGEGEVGFISGLPKSYKSWLGLDVGVSLGIGGRFLDTFACRKVNTLLVQEEDPRTVLQDRLVKVAAAKGLISATPTKEYEVEFQYELPTNLWIISNRGFTITNEDHLDEIRDFVLANDIRAIVMDPLMMIAEAVDEFKAFEMMSAVFKPLKRLRAQTGAAIILIHHHVKNAGEQAGARAMYGSVALWAWEEAALHLNVVGPGRIVAERFSKHSQLQPLTIDVGDTSLGWTPTVTIGLTETRDLVDLIGQYADGMTTEELAAQANMGRDRAIRELKSLEEQGKIESHSGPKQPGHRGRRPRVWLLKGG